MKRTLTALVAVAAAALVSVSLAAGTGQAKTVKFSATLTVSQETDHPKGTKAGASGLFTATLTGSKLKWTLTWKNLTGPASQAHIHIGKRGVSGNVLVPALPARLHLPEPRIVDSDQGEHQADRERRNLRQRAHHEEQPRRNPRTSHPRDVGARARRITRRER